MLFVFDTKRRGVLNLSLALGLGVMSSCGQQTLAPSLDSRGSGRGESSVLVNPDVALATSNIRANSDEGDGPASAVMKVFSKAIDPLTLQPGGSVKISLPLSQSILNAGTVRGIQFLSGSESLRGSVVQGRLLNLVVAEDAPEGRYEGSVIIRLMNGREAVQRVAVSVIP
jgi:hypothetical protein